MASKMEIRNTVKDTIAAQFIAAFPTAVQIDDYTYALPMGTAEDNGAPKPPKRNMCFLTAEDDEYPTVLNLTQDQINLMQYLLDRGFLGGASFVPTREGMEVDAP